jgi:hypothetical protein
MAKKMAKKDDHDRSFPIDFEGLRHAPENELGVVFLFSKVAKRLGFLGIDVIQPHFPDCWAMKRTNSGVKRTWVEFEYNSRSFSPHIRQLKGLRPKKGFVVCWEHNWEGCEKYVEGVIELRSELKLGRQIWIQNTLPNYQGGLDEAPKKHNKECLWTVAPKTRPGDLLLMYRAGRKSQAKECGVDEDLLQSIANVFIVRSYPRRDEEFGFEAEVAQIALLPNPLRLDQMRVDRVLKSAPFIRKFMIGRNNVTPYWYRIYDLILQLNPYRKVQKALKAYRPEVI